jgi:hypothetical protein
LRARFAFDPWRVGAPLRDDARRTVEKLNAEDHPAKGVAGRRFSHGPRDDHPPSIAEILGRGPAVAHFDGLYANWLKARVECVEQTKIDNGEEISAKRRGRRDEVARQLLVASAPYPDHV